MLETTAIEKNKHLCNQTPNLTITEILSPCDN